MGHECEAPEREARPVPPDWLGRIKHRSRWRRLQTLCRSASSRPSGTAFGCPRLRHDPFGVLAGRTAHLRVQRFDGDLRAAVGAFHAGAFTAVPLRRAAGFGAVVGCHGGISKILRGSLRAGRTQSHQCAETTSNALSPARPARNVTAMTMPDSRPRRSRLSVNPRVPKHCFRGQSLHIWGNKADGKL